MNNRQNIFYRFLYGAVACVFACVVSSGAFAAGDGGCDNEENDYINPELALCSVHAYNMGLDENPSSDMRPVMRGVVGLKTTVITQQMKKQYDYMDAMIRRFRVQLQKATLQTKLQAAGAAASDSSGGSERFVSNDRNIFIAGVNNCNNEITSLKKYECLYNNLNTITNSSANGSNVTVELKKQLANDYSLTKGSKSECRKYTDIKTRKIFQTCLDDLRDVVRTEYEKEQREDMKARNSRY